MQPDREKLEDLLRQLDCDSKFGGVGKTDDEPASLREVETIRQAVSALLRAHLAKGDTDA